MSKKEIILTAHAPQPIGPYSQATKAAGFLFCSGQIALDPKTGHLDASIVSDVVGQAKQVMQNLKAVVEAGGAKMENVVKTTIFLKNMGDFPKVNEVYGSFFSKEPPARSTVEVSRLPKDVLVEVEAVAIL